MIKAKESLINSEWELWNGKIIQIEARIAANSGSIWKIRNEKLDDFNVHKHVHELIRGSLNW